MIAKADVIAHGSNAVRYSVDKELGEVIKANYMPDDITPSAMWSRMMMHQQLHRDKLNRHRHLENTSIRIEISPAREESKNFTIADWQRLAEEFVREFDTQDIRRKDGRKEDGHTHLANSQYVVSLHRDSKGKILHLHINANRVDMDGHVNNSYMIGKRAVAAANKINERRGWIQSMQRREENIEAIHHACIEALRSMDTFNWFFYEGKLKAKGYDVKLVRSQEGKVVGYSIRKGNSTYKSSELGHSRELMPSKIERTWAKLHQDENIASSSLFLFGDGTEEYATSKRTKYPQPDVRSSVLPQRDAARERYEDKTSVEKEQAKQREPVKSMPVMVHHDFEANGTKFSIDIPKDANDIIMESIKMPDSVLWSTLIDIQHTALLLFVNYLNAATTLSESCGGGGGSAPDSGWGRKKNEDDREWARRCAQRAGIMHIRRPRGYHR